VLDVVPELDAGAIVHQVRERPTKPERRIHKPMSITTA
jgi:hypothetical protein